MFTPYIWSRTITLSFAFNFALVTADSDAFRAIEQVDCSHLPEDLLNGTSCSVEKTCFFGEKECAGIGRRPETKCVCSSKTQSWSCVTEICPSLPPTYEFMPASGCLPDGVADLSGNHPLCPVNFPPVDQSSDGCAPPLYDKVCSYGTSVWYGPNVISVASPSA